MEKINLRKAIRNLLMVLLVIDFLVLVVALTNFIPNNPFREYRLELGLGFIVLAGFARQICKNCREKNEQNNVSLIEDEKVK